MDTLSPDSQALPQGTHLHEFVIERVLGSGGFGITYLARDTSLGRQVVIKENLPSQFAWRETATGTVRPRHTSGGDLDDYEWSMKNFLREAETLASLDHPGIVRVLRKFEANGTAYFVMPFVEGVPFDRLINDRNSSNKPFSENELRGLLERMLNALSYLHERGIYHRDIKPGNILISNEGIPVLIDFGSARQRLSERSMTIIESAGYTPFEQLQSHGNIGPWSDLYALGATLVKAMTGETLPKAADRVLEDPWLGLSGNSKFSSLYTPVFLCSIEKALAPLPKGRWQDAGEWLAMLRKPATPTMVHVRVPPASVPSQGPPSAPVAPISQTAATSGKTGKALPWVVVALIVLGIFALAKSISADKDASRTKKMADEAALQQQRERAEAADIHAIEAEARVTKAEKEHTALEASQQKAKAQNAVERRQELGRQQAVSNAMVSLGIHKQPGDLSEDELEAVKWYRKAVDAGDATAMRKFGNCYYNGTGVAKDAAEAVKWYRKAADSGDAAAMYNLGLCCQNGTGVAKDEADAVKWYRRAACAGDTTAMRKFGNCYYNGTGVAKDAAEAVKWYCKAADSGDAAAMYNLGLCCQNGTGVAKDEADAVKWYRKAAEAGDTTAMFNLGFCCQNGTGVAKDEAEAVKWYRKAAEVGDEETAKLAKKLLNELGK